MPPRLLAAQDDGNLLSFDGCSIFCQREAAAATLPGSVVDLPVIDIPLATTPGETPAWPGIPSPLGANSNGALTAPASPNRAPLGDTGPATAAILAMGAAAGAAWVRRRWK